MKRSEWTNATIGELIESGVIVGHKDGNHGSQYPRVHEFGDVGVPFLTAKSLDSGRIDIAGAPRLGADKADKLKIGFVKPNDVLLSHNATVGRVAMMHNFEGRILIGTSLTYFRVDPNKLSPRYLAVFFAGSEFQRQLEAVMSQTTRNQVPITAQRRLSLIIPPLEEQERIAHILGTLDDKIDLNRRMNRTLEAMAQAIFKSWFVDFEPVKAKAAAKAAGASPAAIERAAMAAIAGRSIEEAIAQGGYFDDLTPSNRESLAQTAALFPDTFQDSELGGIPEGWSVSPLKSVCQVINGRALSDPLIYANEFN